MIAEPKRETHVPTIPEFLHIGRSEWTMKVLRHVKSQEIRYADRKEAVARKIKKQIKTICVHVKYSVLYVSSTVDHTLSSLRVPLKSFEWC